jgi:hypothetical protein
VQKIYHNIGFWKNAKFLPKIVENRRKIVIITSTPDWAIFRQWDDSLLWSFFLNITEDAQIVGLLFPTAKVVY